MIDATVTRLTRQQRVAMEVIRDSVMWPTTRQVAEDMVPGHPSMTYDRAHAVLVRLEKRGLVERHSTVRKAVWSLTDRAREVLAA
jgi:Fe2+ or Zn2+ uptake regulation protein